MSPLTADDVFKNSTPKSLCQKKMFTVFLSKKVFSMNLFFVSMHPSNDICMEKSSQNINYSEALRTPKCVSPDSWKFWDIHNGVKYILKSYLNSWLPQILRDIFDQRNKTVSLRSPLVVLEDTKVSFPKTHEIMFKCEFKIVLGPLRYTSQLYRV